MKTKQINICKEQMSLSAWVIQHMSSCCSNISTYKLLFSWKRESWMLDASLWVSVEASFLLLLLSALVLSYEDTDQNWSVLSITSPLLCRDGVDMKTGTSSLTIRVTLWSSFSLCLSEVCPGHSTVLKVRSARREQSRVPTPSRPPGCCQAALECGLVTAT